MSYHPKYCTLLYGLSCLLDAVDGPVARALGQTSKFGAVLDMVTDRCAFSSTSVCCKSSNELGDARLRVCYVTYHRLILHMLSSSSF